MKDFFTFCLGPVVACLIIMILSADAYKKSCGDDKNAWYWVSSDKLAWLFSFSVNLLLIYFLLFVCGVTVSKWVETEKHPDAVSVPDTTQQSDTISYDKEFITNDSGRFITHVTLTSYNPVVEQCDSDPLITADGTKIDLNKLKRGEIKYCAVSRNLLAFIPLGSIIHIEGYGIYEVRDTMNKRFSHCIDILQHIDKKNFKKTGVRVVKIK